MAAGSFAVYAFADDTVFKQGSEPADIEIQGGASQAEEADLSEYADAVLSDYDAKASAEVFNHFHQTMKEYEDLDYYKYKLSKCFEALVTSFVKGDSNGK